MSCSKWSIRAMVRSTIPVRNVFFFFSFYYHCGDFLLSFLLEREEEVRGLSVWPNKQQNYPIELVRTILAN